MNSTSISLSHVLWKWWNALFVPEEIIRINFGLHMHQPVEVILEVLSTKNTCFDKTCVRIVVHAQIKIPVIHICFPWVLGDIRCHVPINLPRPIYMLCNVFLCILPTGMVPNHELGTFSMRERSLRF
ncbi:hypothetical protein Peur_060507 [Populus x canadensis]